MLRLTDFKLPTDLGEFNIKAEEVMYYLYLPLKKPGENALILPNEPRLNFIHPLLWAVMKDEPDRLREEYLYLTAKKMFVGGGVTANRPGWHADGFMSDDLNYVWSDCVPTIFNSGKFDISPDHLLSLKEFEEQADESLNLVYPDRHLLKLDDKVIHRVNTDVPQQVMRTFVKITLSKNRFNLKDNSRNPRVADDGVFYDRAMARNDPHQAQADHYKANPKDDHFA